MLRSEKQKAKAKNEYAKYRRHVIRVPKILRTKGFRVRDFEYVSDLSFLAFSSFSCCCVVVLVCVTYLLTNASSVHRQSNLSNTNVVAVQKVERKGKRGAK